MCLSVNLTVNFCIEAGFVWFGTYLEEFDAPPPLNLDRLTTRPPHSAVCHFFVNV